MEKFTVVREHFGDRAYARGDVREALASDVAHLVPHVLKPRDSAVGKQKAEKAPLNKAEKTPLNKAV